MTAPVGFVGVAVDHTTKLSFVTAPADPNRATERLLADAAVLLDSLPAAAAAARRLLVVAAPRPASDAVTLSGMLLSGVCHDASGMGSRTIRCQWGVVTDLSRRVVEIYRATGRPPTVGRFTAITDSYDGCYATDLVDEVGFDRLPARLRDAA